MPLLRGSDTLGSDALQDGDSDDSDSEVSSDSNTSGLSSDSWMLGAKDEPWWGLGSTVRPRVGCGCLDFFGQSSFHHYFESLQHSECIILIVTVSSRRKEETSMPSFLGSNTSCLHGKSKSFCAGTSPRTHLEISWKCQQGHPYQDRPSLTSLAKVSKKSLEIILKVIKKIFRKTMLLLYGESW